MTKFRYLDSRVQRTTSDFYDSLFDLLKSKDYSEISVTDIINHAGYSRSTFYVHYTGKDELLAEVIKYLFDDMIVAYRSTYQNNDSVIFNKMVNEPINFLNHFIKFKDYYRILLGDHIHVDFRSLITSKITEVYLADFELYNFGENMNVDDNLYYRYTSYGLAGIVLDWIEEDFPTNAELFAIKLVQIFNFSTDSLKVKRT